MEAALLGLGDQLDIRGKEIFRLGDQAKDDILSCDITRKEDQVQL